MPDEIQDVKTETVASSATEVVKAPEQTTETASTAAKANTPQDLMKGLEAAIQKGAEAGSSPAKEEGQKAEEGKVEPEDKAKEEKTEEGKEQDPKEEGKVEEDPKGPIPYTRFQEVNEKLREHEAAAEEAKPYLEAQRTINDFCTRNEISNEDFGQALQLAAALKKDPARAYEILKPLLPQLQESSGEKLSPEYQKLIDDGHDPELVKRISKAEANKKFAEGQIQRTKQEVQERAVRDHTIRMHTAFTGWTKTEQGKDPDFAEGSKKHNMFLRLATQDVQQNGAPTEAQLLKICAKVKAEIDEIFSPPKQTNGTTKHIKTTQATTRGSTPPKTLEEAMQRGYEHAIARR